MDYRNIDCGNRPDPAAFDSDWARTTIRAVEKLDPRLTALTRALNKTHVNGGAEVAQFEIDAADAVAWALSRNRLDKYNFFRRFFEAPAIIDALPELGAVNDQVVEFKGDETTIATSSSLASLLLQGGAYRQFSGSSGEAQQLADRFTRAVFEDRYSEVNGWTNWCPWAEWFFDVAWDYTYFWFNSRTGVATVLIVTDSD